MTGRRQEGQKVSTSLPIFPGYTNRRFFLAVSMARTKKLAFVVPPEMIRLKIKPDLLDEFYGDRLTIDIEPALIEQLISQRNEARAAKDWAMSDQIRDRLLDHGIELSTRDPMPACVIRLAGTGRALLSMG